MLKVMLNEFTGAQNLFYAHYWSTCHMTSSYADKETLRYNSYSKAQRDTHTHTLQLS